MTSQYGDGANPFDFNRRYRGSGYNEDHDVWRSTLQDFLEQEVIPHIQAWEEAGEFPRELYEKAANIGLIGLGFPEEYGGTETKDPWYSVVTTEELAQIGAGGLGASLMVHGIGLPPVIAHGSEEMKARVAPQVLSGKKVHALAITEPNAGSDVASIQTKAVRKGNYYEVTGQKIYITGGMRADYLSAAVRTGDDSHSGVSLLLIETNAEGVARTKMKKMGWLCSDTAHFFFDKVRVPVENLIGQEGNGFPAIMVNFLSERLSMSTSANAFARVCLEDAIAWARERRTFGKRLIDHQVIRHKMAEMARKINSTQAYIDQCAWRLHQGEKPVADLALLKVQATRTMEFCAREAMQILGGAGYIRDNRVERIYREVRVMAIGGGSEEIMRDLVAKQMGL